MKLSVIIPTYNRKKSLIETLRAYCQQSYKDFEIIVIDDGSTDGTREMIKGLQLSLKMQYIFQQNKGPASARNSGIKHSKEDVVFFTGDDIIPSNNLLEEHVKNYHNSDEKLAVLGLTQWASQINITPFKKYIGDYHFAYSAIKNKKNVHWGYFFTSNVSINKKLLLKAGLFDEEFPFAAYEDTELGYRLSSQGMKLVLNEKAIAYHNHDTNFKSYQRTMFNKGIAAVILAKKVPELKRKASYKETDNQVKFIIKKMLFNRFTTYFVTEIICFLDLLHIRLPKVCYAKILDYYRIEGIKKSL